MDTNPGWGGWLLFLLFTQIFPSNIKKMSTNEEPHEQQDKTMKRNL